MDRTTLARKLREALFDHIEAGRRDALQDSAIDSLFERVLASCEKQPLIRKEALTDLLASWNAVETGSFTVTEITTDSYTLSPQPTCQCKPATSCGRCWDD